MKNILYIVLIITALFFTGCGEGTVDIDQSLYEPKIVMQGFIYPDRKVEKIEVTRNFPLDQDIDIATLFLFNADVTISDLQTEQIDTLKFNFDNFTFEDHDNNFQIVEGHSYKLNINAVIEGKELQASSITNVPFKGLKAEQDFLGSMKYREKDANGEIINFIVKFDASPGSEFYALSITPDNGELQNFILDNAYSQSDDLEDYEEDLDFFRNQFSWLQNVNPNSTKLSAPIEWFNIWFYGRHRVIIYATDQNYKDFLLTHQQVQEFDGNFHEPEFHIEGEGIGVFASAVTDTVYFDILK